MTSSASFCKEAALIGLSDDAFQKICMEGNGEERDLIYLLSIGKITTAEALRIISEKTGREISTDLWHLTFHPEKIEGMEGIISLLKKKGHRVVCATNTMESHYLTHLERGDYSVFDQVYASHLMGKAKPEQSFFTLILSAEGFCADDAFFIDDREENCKAAESVGIKSFLFDTKNAASSVKALKEKLSL